MQYSPAQYSKEGTDPKGAIVLVEPIAAKLSAVREAMSDPLFLADLQEIADDFKYVDPEA